jgi:Ca2+-binding EF-hand superfamily protein
MASKTDLEEMFYEADVDKNNYLTIKEVCDVMRKCGYKGDDKVIKEFFSKADASDDDKLTFDEYKAAINNAPPQLHRAALMRRCFKKFDTDGNGVLNRKELQRATAILGDHFSDEDIEILMEVLDKDHSDTLDMEEFIQAFMNAKR